MLDASAKNNEIPEKGRYRVFVGGLSVKVSEEELREYLVQYGELIECDLIRTKEGESKGYAFGCYTRAEDREKALGKNHFIKERQFEIRPLVDSNQNLEMHKEISTRKLFISNLRDHIREDNLLEAFSFAGEIEDVIISRDPRTQKSKGFGFILFKNKASVSLILQGQSKRIMRVKGSTVVVKECIPKKEIAKSKLLESPGASLEFDFAQYQQRVELINNFVIPVPLFFGESQPTFQQPPPGFGEPQKFVRVQVEKGAVTNHQEVKAVEKKSRDPNTPQLDLDFLNSSDDQIKVSQKMPAAPSTTNEFSEAFIETPPITESSADCTPNYGSFVETKPSSTEKEKSKTQNKGAFAFESLIQNVSKDSSSQFPLPMGYTSRGFFFDSKTPHRKDSANFESPTERAIQYREVVHKAESDSNSEGEEQANKKKQSDQVQALNCCTCFLRRFEPAVGRAASSRNIFDYFRASFGVNRCRCINSRLMTTVRRSSHLTAMYAASTKGEVCSLASTNITGKENHWKRERLPSNLYSCFPKPFPRKLEAACLTPEAGAVLKVLDEDVADEAQDHWKRVDHHLFS